MKKRIQFNIKIPTSKLELKILRHLHQIVRCPKKLLRVRYAQDRAVIDELVRRNLIEDNQEHYSLTFSGLLAARPASVQQDLVQLDRLFVFLKAWFSTEPDPKITTTVIADEFSIDAREANRLLNLFFSLPTSGLWTQRGGQGTVEGVQTIALSEGFLDYPEFKDLLKAVSARLSPRAETYPPVIAPAKPPKKSEDSILFIRRLGEGGQGISDLVKFKNAECVRKSLKDSRRVARFQREIEATNHLKTHPGIIKIIDSQLDAPKPHYFMEYCRGGDLDKSTIWETSAEAKLSVFSRICEATAAAHDANLIHRDLKPANILFRSEDSYHDVVLSDFGLVYIPTEDRLTQTEEAVGARWFMAPELEEGREDQIKKSVDVYSLGKLLYWMLSGRKRLIREDYDASGRNLVEIWNDPRFQHFNEFFRQTIQRQPEARLQDAREALKKFEISKFKFQFRSNVPNRNFPQQCIYCRDGEYVIYDGPGRIYDRLGIELRGNPRTKALICKSCGNLQLFFLDKLHQDGSWGLLK